MNKYIKITISVILTFSIYIIGYISIAKNNYHYNDLLYWSLIIIEGVIVAIPVINYWWDKVNKWLWNLPPDTYTKGDVLRLFLEFMDEVGKGNIQTKESFRRWLDKNGL